MKVACIGYREWALNIYDALIERTDETFLLFKSKSEFNENALRDFNPDLILFYGWSWIVSEKLLDDYKCLMLHPSPLPKYRGGSPIQNQIIDGKKKSKVTIFVMNSEIDSGDIISQGDISLEGTLNNIFEQIENVGIKLTLEIIKNRFKARSQNHNEATYFKRRTKADSEITLEEITDKSSDFLYNKIRMLADPYPNAFIKTKDGKKLVIIEAKIEE